ncbi:MAG: glycosyltransferase [bacterium]|nr:glycosyltransferase [bacterium]
MNMAPLKNLLRKYQHLLPLAFQRKYFKSVRLVPRGRVPIGRALLSFSLISAGMPPNHPVFAHHSGPWESSMIASFLLKRGYIVDIIHYTNRSFVPKERYDVILTMMEDLYRLVAYAPNPPESIVKIWLLYLSSVDQSNASEMERIAALEARRPGALYTPKRQEIYERQQEKTLALADGCTVAGNQLVLDTYPERFRHKITPVYISASPLSWVKSENEYVPSEREFVWYFGNGAVRKGLDIVLEAFAKHPEWKLHVIGTAPKEPDFMKIYRKELTQIPNITVEGYLDPSSKRFEEITRASFCFIAPSCTEGTSTATATMMQVGLYPLVSRETGVDLPEGCGQYFNELSVEEVERLVALAFALPEDSLEKEIRATQTYALHAFSREAFAHRMEEALGRIIDRKRV